jgi:hypothetical protein
MANVGKSDCERTFASVTGNDEIAPKPDMILALTAPPAPTRSARQTFCGVQDWRNGG